MRNAKVLLQNTAMFCIGCAAAAGCQSAHHGACCSSAAASPAPTAMPGPATALRTETPVVAIPQQVPMTQQQTPIFQQQVPVTEFVPSQEFTSYASVPEIIRSPMSHADDYSWLEGELEYIHADNGHWKVRYAPLSADDIYGGSVVLDTDVRLEKYREGDHVHVEGELVQTRSSVFVSGPLYRVHVIRPISGGIR